MTDVLVVAAITVSTLLGLAIGSFLNVVVWRLPLGKSLNHPASHCPRCGHPIRWWDNLPVLSWLILRGKCRDCGEPISIRYPAVEAFTGIAFGGVTAWLLFRDSLDLAAASTAAIVALALSTVAYLYFAAISIALTLIDLDTRRLPNAIVLPSYVVTAVLLGASSLLTGDTGSLIRTAIGAAALFAAYFLMVIVYPGGMGFGDVKLAGVVGIVTAWIGWGALAVGAFAAFVLGGIFALALMVTRRAGRKSAIPFGPWMIAGAWVGIFIGEEVSQWYLALFGLA